MSGGGFHMFMIETKRRLEARGERLRMEDMPGICGEPWDRMTTEQKNVYKEKGKNYKKSDEFLVFKKQKRGLLPRRRMREDDSTRRRPHQMEEDEFVEPISYIVRKFFRLKISYNEFDFFSFRTKRKKRRKNSVKSVLRIVKRFWIRGNGICRTIKMVSKFLFLPIDRYEKIVYL